MLTTTPNDIGGPELEGSIGRGDNAVNRMGLNLQGLVAPDKYSRSFPGMNKSRLPDLGLQSRWEVDRGRNYVDRQWEAIRSNL